MKILRTMQIGGNVPCSEHMLYGADVVNKYDYLVLTLPPKHPDSQLSTNTPRSLAAYRQTASPGHSRQTNWSSSLHTDLVTGSIHLLPSNSAYGSLLGLQKLKSFRSCTLPPKVELAPAAAPAPAAVDSTFRRKCVVLGALLCRSACGCCVREKKGSES